MNLNTILKNHKCRTCYNATKGLKSLEKLATDEKQPPKSYAEILKEIANINTMEESSKSLTQFICGGCSRKLRAAHAFVQQAQEVNKKLLTMLVDVPVDDSKQIDCLQELQVDIDTCLEIKMENDDIEGVVDGGEDAGDSVDDVQQCEVELKLEDSEEGILSNKSNTNILVNKKDEEAIDIINLKNIDTCDEEVIEDIFDLDNAKPDTDISDYEDNNEDPFSEDSDWQEELKSSPKKIDKKKNNSKTDKSDVDNNVLQDEDIAVPCDLCEKIFKNSKALAMHKSTSHIPEDQKCSCPLCGHKFTRSCNMYKHMRTFHGPDTVPLIRKPSNEERPYQCDKCSRNYVKKKHLNVHVKTKHSNENENEIKEDKPDNASPGDIKKPKRYEQPSLCSICGGSFTSKTFLIVHMRRHTGERPFKCDLCDRAYPRKTELTVHRRLHTGEKPFECKLCGKAFRVSGKLATHMRSHTDIRPYKCTQCERSFKYSKDLSIHFRIHTGERPYCCNVCGSTFTQSNSLKAHRMKLGHMEVVA